VTFDPHFKVMKFFEDEYRKFSIFVNWDFRRLVACNLFIYLLRNICSTIL